MRTHQTEACSLVLLCWILLQSCKAKNAIDLEDLASNNTWVITHSSPCSATCGLGIRTQQLCSLGSDDQVNTKECHIRQVQCLDNWQCGLKTQTVTAGQRVELDCLEEVMEAMGRFAFVVSWRFAKGIITTDNQLFLRHDVPGLDRVILNPVKEVDAGTYRCDALDTSYRRVKRMYKGMKVISPQVLRLDFTKGLIEWEKPGDLWENVTLVTGKLYPSSTVLNVVLFGLSISITMAMIVFLTLFAISYWKGRRQRLGIP